MKTTTTTRPHPKGHNQTTATDPGSYILEIASYKRCSRPLCSSQTTTPYHTPHTPPSPKKEPTCVPGAARKPETNKPHTTETPDPSPQKGTGRKPGAMVLLPQDPTVCQTLNRPYPPRHRSRTLSREPPYWVPGKNRRPLFVDIPPVSTRRRTIVCATGVLLTTPPHPHTRGKMIVGAP